MSQARYHVYDSAVLDAPVETVWEVIRDIVHLLPIVFGDAVKDYRWVDGGSADKVPSRFQFTLAASGETALEEVVARSEVERSLTYRMLGQVVGIEGYVATYTLKRITHTPGKTFIDWPREFSVVAGQDPAEVVPAIAALTAQEVAALEKYFRGRKST